MITRQFISFMLAFFLLFSNTGFALHIHYCHGAMQTISSEFALDFTKSTEESNEAKTCCASHEKSENPCCEDSYLQADVDDVVMQYDIHIDPFFVHTHLVEISSIFTNGFADPLDLDYYCDAHAPPCYTLYSQRIFYDCN
jgi:hypothetical protein